LLVRFVSFEGRKKKEKAPGSDWPFGQGRPQEVHCHCQTGHLGEKKKKRRGGDWPEFLPVDLVDSEEKKRKKKKKKKKKGDLCPLGGLRAHRVWVQLYYPKSLKKGEGRREGGRESRRKKGVSLSIIFEELYIFPHGKKREKKKKGGGHPPPFSVKPVSHASLWIGKKRKKKERGKRLAVSPRVPKQRHPFPEKKERKKRKKKKRKGRKRRSAGLEQKVHSIAVSLLI